MGEQDFEKRLISESEKSGVDENENENGAAISNFENEGGFVPPHEQKESFIDRTAKYCRVVHGQLLCKIGEHEYKEVGSEEFHGGRDKVVRLFCSRKNCPRPKAWTEWRKKYDNSGEYKQVL